MSKASPFYYAGLWVIDFPEDPASKVLLCRQVYCTSGELEHQLGPVNFPVRQGMKQALQ